MFNRRFMLCLVALVMLPISYLGYRAYQRHVKFERYISESEVFVNSFNKENKQERDFKEIDRLGKASQSSDDIKSVNSQGLSERQELHRSPLAVLPPEYSSKELIKPVSGPKPGNFSISADEVVTQLVETPDGEIHEVFVPQGLEYQDGDAISPLELDPYSDIGMGGTVEVNGRKYDVPDGVKRHVYAEKLILAEGFSISMEEVEKKIASGELNVSSSEEYEKDLKPPLFDKPPVKVSFLQEGGIGWMRKLARYSQSGDGTAEHSSHSDAPPVKDTISSRRIPSSPNTPPNSVSPSSAAPRAPKSPFPPTTENIETRISEQLSSDRFDKAQQLVDQYGTVEGLRRLKEIDPEAARRFERERPRSESPQLSEPSRNVPDSKESEQ